MSTSQKQAARKFVEYWTFQRGGEKGGPTSKTQNELRYIPSKFIRTLGDYYEK